WPRDWSSDCALPICAIDHHNVQLTLLIWSLALAIPARARDGVLAGVCCALSVAVGAEMYPAVAALAAMIALRWIGGGEVIRHAKIGRASCRERGKVG